MFKNRRIKKEKSEKLKIIRQINFLVDRFNNNRNGVIADLDSKYNKYDGVMNQVTLLGDEIPKLESNLKQSKIILERNSAKIKTIQSLGENINQTWIETYFEQLDKSRISLRTENEEIAKSLLQKLKKIQSEKTS